MTAICKTITIHGNNLSHLLDYGSDHDKTSVSLNGLSNVLDYAANPLKTIVDLDDGDQEILVSGVLCQPETALLDFSIGRQMYLASNGDEHYASFDFLDKRMNATRSVHKAPVTAIHLIQSFAEKDLDCHVVHQVGIELCERLGVQGVVDTHLNKDHLHNHIIINAYMPDGVSKFCLTADKRMQIRELSDEIQREYGIELCFSNPRTQLRQSKGKHNYREWDAKRQNISWKEQMKRDIADARSVSDCREDFITIMQDYGYKIARQEADSITWWNKSGTRKIRDKTLGDIYELRVLFSESLSKEKPVASPDYVIESDSTPDRKYPKPISIARYDWNGRRRSDLELLIRKAIALIRHFGNRYSTMNSTSHTINKKLELMEQALETVQTMNFTDKEAFTQAMNEVGARLNCTKSKLKRMDAKMNFYQTIAPLLSSYEETKRIVDSIHYWPDGNMPDLMIDVPTEAAVHKAKASRCPMSNEQKRNLYLVLQKHPEYTLSGDGFSDISSMEAEDIFSFFRGESKDCPSVLRSTLEVTMDRTYQKRNAYLKQQFVKPIQRFQMDEVSALLSAHGIHKNVSDLTQFDVMNIRNCYGTNPFSEAPIGLKQSITLSARLSERGLTLNREPKYVLPSEYNKLMDYLDGLSRTKPELLRSSRAVSPMDVQKLQTFMEAKGITSSIPLSAMCKSDIDRMYGYVLSQGHIPDCVTNENALTDRTNDFITSIQIDGITEKKQLLLLSLRNQTKELLSLGIDPACCDTFRKEMEHFRQEYTALETECTSLSAEYHQLVTLKQQLTYAESPSFLYGSLFNDKVHECPEVIEKEEREPANRQEVQSHAAHEKKSLFDISFDL